MSVSTHSVSIEGDRVKTLVSDLSFQEKKQLVNELLGTKELEGVWNDVFENRIEHYLQAEGNLGEIFSTLADRIGHGLVSPQVSSHLA
ncbi:MAG: hypothetical protein J7647_22230 [Cyanobacteria bacterium SBLK]|nr:hypothetical protein [Cyanobacteria bacterium SBLK]